MKYSESKPFSTYTGFVIFVDNWCYECTHYKKRFDGFPAFPWEGGCPVLDAMERAQFDLSKFPSKQIIEERDEDGNVMYSHKCTKFKRRKTNGQKENE